VSARDATSYNPEWVHGWPWSAVYVRAGGTPSSFIAYGEKWHAFYTEPVDVCAGLRELDS